MEPVELQDESGWSLRLWLQGRVGRVHLEPPAAGWTVSGLRRLYRAMHRLQQTHGGHRFHVVLPGEASRGFTRLAERTGFRRTCAVRRNGRLFHHWIYTGDSQ